MAIKQLKDTLPAINTVLILGAGLGSMVRVMRKWKADPHCTLVEKDKVVLEWAMDLLQPDGPDKLVPVCDDAAHFIRSATGKYDLVFLDVFNGRFVPQFVCTEEFMLLCRNRLAPGGHIAFNYIVNDEDEWRRVLHTFQNVFPRHEVVTRSVNRILIGAN